jgi:hypothetical protein
LLRGVLSKKRLMDWIIRRSASELLDQFLSIPFRRSAGVLAFAAKKPTLEIERHIYKPDQHRYFDQRANHGRKSHPGVDTENSYCHGNSQLEVVARSRE